MNLEKILAGFANQHLGLLLLRVPASLLMMMHGWAKFLKLQAGGEIEFFNFLNLGPVISLILTIIGELIAPAFIVLGFQTRTAAIPVIVTMAVAAFVAHAGDPIADREHALLYLFVFSSILLLGGGKYGVTMLGGKRN
jgi:putative oxidoreductase